jgi:hypothetical protein
MDIFVEIEPTPGGPPEKRNLKNEIGFYILWNDQFSDVALFYNPRKRTEGQFTMQGVDFVWVAPNHLEIRLPENLSTTFPADHPITVLAHRVFGAWNGPFVERGVWRMFPESVMKELHRLQGERAAKTCLKKALVELCVGWAKFYFRTGRTVGLQPLNGDAKNGEELFGLVWIFPWAPAVIREYLPRCLMSDGTFDAMDPYTLEILNAIVANESIPLGLSVAPTETTESYCHLYDHLASALGPDGVDILKGIKFESDQGQGLKGFVLHWQLESWLYCHRHLIEGAGASSLGGDMVRRLLLCADLQEARQVAATIRSEMASLGRRAKIKFRHEAYRRHLEEMLLAVERDTDDLRFWARWHRLGCPTTTNAQESLHRWLNEETRTCRSFYSRLEKVKAYLWRRFEDINEDYRRKTRSHTRWLPVLNDDRESEACKHFYRALHDFQGQTVVKGFRFPDLQVPDTFPAAIWELTTKGPPQDWNGPRVPQSEDDEGQSDGPDADAEPAPRAERRDRSIAYNRAGRGIISTVKIVAKAKKVRQTPGGQEGINATVWSIGGEMGLFRAEIITADEEAAWRDQIYQIYDIC